VHLPCAKEGPSRGSLLAPRSLALLAVAFLGACGGRPRPTNVLLVTIDTLRADRVGAYGCPFADTPALDALAREGALFREAYTPVPYTLPAHASLLTGTLPPRHGVRDNGKRALPSTATTIAEWLGRKGFATGAFVGAFPLDRRFGLDQGFSVYDDAIAAPADAYSIAERRGEEVVARARRWLDEEAREPFFAWVHLFDPHAPYAAPEPYRARFAARPYDGEVAYADACLGRLLGGLGARRRRTLLVVTADHGESLGDHGEATHGLTLYEPAVRVPLILAWEGGIAPGLRPAARASLIDVFPTVCAALGWPAPAAVEGRSLLEALAGPEGEERPVYLETFVPLLHYGWAPLLGWRAGRWKYVAAPRAELYDLEADPGELRDRREEAREVADALSSGLRRASAASAEGALEGGARALTPEEAARFAAVGYVWAGTAPPAGEERDPKDLLPILRSLDAASVAIVRGEFQSAEAELDGVLRRDPGNRLARRYLGDLAEARGDLAGAEAAHRRSLSLDPSDREASLRLAAVLCQGGKFEEALAALGPILRGEEPFPDARGWEGVALLGLGRIPEARRALEEAVGRDPRHAAALHALGRLERREGKTAEAERWLRRALACGEERATAAPRLDLAEVLLEKGGSEEERGAARAEALEQVEAVLRHYPRWKRALELRDRVGSPPR
jgi:arylsulfatase A-like enzyme/Tfp pilus assembly protein PilF